MQPRRKQDDWVEAAFPAEAVSVEYATPVKHDSEHRADDLPASPALLLQEQLAARLAGSTPVTTEAHDAIQSLEVKLPMVMRVATILGLSVALWGGIYLAVLGTITK